MLQQYNEILTKQGEYFTLLSNLRNNYATQEEFEQDCFGLTQEQFSELEQLKFQAELLLTQIKEQKIPITNENIINGFKEAV